MANYIDTDSDLSEIFFKLLDNDNNLRNNIAVKLLTNNKLNQPYKVFKASDMYKYITASTIPPDGLDVVVVLNEDILSQLEPTMVELLFQEILTSLFYDSEKDKLSIVPHDVTTYSGIIKKYGIDEYLRTQISVSAIIEQMKEKAKEAKSNSKSTSKSK